MNKANEYYTAKSPIAWKESLPPAEKFDALFETWARESVSAASFAAEKPQHENRIPLLVRRKVVQLHEMRICFSDSEKACFRIADSKEGKGGPYNWFSYDSTDRNINPNWEYFVQLAAFRDFVVEYGYDPKWMKFEYHECIDNVSIPVDIGIRMPGGTKIFVEVKERKNQWERLIRDVQAIGVNGVDLNEPDRHNDALRKAKYVSGGKPDYFAGYSPEGFDSYEVKYSTAGRFALKVGSLPDMCDLSNNTSITTRNVVQKEQLILINDLLSFLNEGFRNPLQTIEYLRSETRCRKSNCEQKECENIVSYFADERPWASLDKFFEWCSQWYSECDYEEPVTAVFIISLLAQFLSSKMKMDERAIAEHLIMEFRGRQRNGHLAPPCLWKSEKSVCVKKINSDRSICCDFYILPYHYLPSIVAEIKVAIPSTSPRSILNAFLSDLEKCREWLELGNTRHIREQFGIDSFSYAMAILIDLTGEDVLRSLWASSINEEMLLENRIIARLISPIPRPEASIPVDLGDRCLIGAQSSANELDCGQPAIIREARRLIQPGCNDAPSHHREVDLELALAACIRCEETRAQQGVEVRLICLEEVHRFKERLISHIQQYNLHASTPIRHASPWAWRRESSGKPLTHNGREFGVEMRISFSSRGNNL